MPVMNCLNCGAQKIRSDLAQGCCSARQATQASGSSATPTAITVATSPLPPSAASSWLATYELLYRLSRLMRSK